MTSIANLVLNLCTSNVVSHIASSLAGFGNSHTIHILRQVSAQKFRDFLNNSLLRLEYVACNTDTDMCRCNASVYMQHYI